MKPSDIRDKNDEELAELAKELRNQILQMRVGQATNRRVNTAQFKSIRRDIARIQTIQNERRLGLERE